MNRNDQKFGASCFAAPAPVPGKSPWIRAVLCGAALLVFACPSGASIWSWSGGGGADANWNNSANWGFAGIPANGDTVIFSASQPNLVNTNNITGLVLNEVRFVGAGGGYDIRGNPFTLTNNLEATNSTGANEIENYITLAGPSQIVDVTISLTLVGVLSGHSALVKTGAGTLVLNGPRSNLYDGLTTVSGGLLQMSKAGSPPAKAVPHDLVISNATVEDVEGLELTNTANLTIVGGYFQLDDYDDTMGTNLVMTNGTVSSGGGGILSLSPNCTITAAGLDSLFPGLNSGSGTLTLQGPGSLYVESVVSGSANIVQSDPLDTLWYGANTYSGNFTDNSSGYVDLLNSQALGNITNQFTLNGPGFIALSQNINITNQTLTFNNGTFGPDYGSIYSFDNTTNSWTGNFVLNTNCWMDVQTNCGLTFNVVSSISGVGGFTKFGPGEFTLAGPADASSYTGDTIVNAGTLYLQGINIIRYGTLWIGDGVGGPAADVVCYLSDYCIYGGTGGSSVVITNSGLLDLNGHFDDVGPITMSGGTINTEAGTLQLFPPLEVNGGSTATINGNFQLIEDSTIGATNDLDLNAVVSSTGSHTLTKTGAGKLYLNGNNTYSGTNILEQGWLWADNSASLGSPTNATLVSEGATLALLGDFAITNSLLVLNGPGEPYWGALDAETSSGTNIWVGPVILNADSPIAPYGFGAAVVVQGTISGAGGLIVYSNPGNGTNALLYLAGAGANSYSGATTVSNGTLVLDKSIGTVSLPGNLVIESGAAARLAASLQTGDADALLSAGALFDFGPYYARLNTLRGVGTVNFGASGYLTLGLNNGTSEFDGSFTGIGFPTGYTVGKFGTGIFTIGGNSSYTSGITHVAGGTAIINGMQPTVPVLVDAGATLGGSGAIGLLTVNGTVAPGNGGPGILTCSNATFSSSGKLAMQLDGPGPGTGYDQLVTLLAVPPALAGATLQLSQLLTTPVAIGQQFDLLANGSGSALSGIFAGLPEGSIVNLGNYAFTISYLGGSGHDVVLTLVSIPGSAVSSAITSGDGTHAIDPNGCNGFYLVLSNQTSSAMNGVSATLSSLSENAIATQPFAAYPNIPAHGTATNVTPFQVSILPSLVCGTPLTFQLGVNSSLGAFAPTYVLPTGEPAAPVEYDVTGNVSIPDIGTADSTNVVSGFAATPLAKVTVSLYITHPYDSDLTNISLISPDGTTVLLSSANGGGGQNYGSAVTPQSDRTTFADAAATPIAAGSAPFVGTFRPQSPLSAFAGNPTPNGNWHLHIADGFGGSLGTLRGWSLFLSGTGCGAGGGSCALCPDGVTLTNTLTTGSASDSQRIFRNSIISDCGTAKVYPGIISGGPFYYHAYPFYNSSSNTCITVTLTATSADVQPSAYLGSFDPLHLGSNYLGDSGDSTVDGAQSFSVNVPANTNIVVVVNSVSAVGTYTLNVSGGDCPPIMNIAQISTNHVDVSWPTVAGGYNLEATPALGGPAWSGVTNEPFATANRFNVTNSSGSPANQYYRLHAP